MRRRLHGTIAAVSLLCCLLALALWVRSYFAGDAFNRHVVKVSPAAAERSFIRVLSTAGVLSFYRVAGRTSVPEIVAVQTPKNEITHDVLVDPKAARESFARGTRLGFSFQSHPSDAMLYVRTPKGRLTFAGPSVQVSVPHALPVVLFALPPVFWFVRRKRSRRIGRCPLCGYDLRATPERCPECGYAPAHGKRVEAAK